MQTELEHMETTGAPAPAPATVAEMACGCQVEGVDGPPYMARQCAEHAIASTEMEQQLELRLGYELDVYVHEAAGGKRVTRIRPADLTKR